MLEALTHNVMVFLHHHPYWGMVLTCVIAFLEALPVIGTIVPGSVTMTAIGVMVGTGVLPLTLTFAWATIGAFIGDYLGYWFGKHYHHNIRNMWPIKKHKKWLDAGERFFAKHGGKSVIIGRFVGPVRSMIPMIAGILQMPPWRFVFAAVPSAFLWAIVYMGPGILLGALSLELPAKNATAFLFYVLLTVVIVWLTTILIKLFLQKVWQLIDAIIAKIWRFLRQHKPYHWLTATIADPREPDQHSQLTLLIFAVLLSALAAALFYSVLHGSTITQLNAPLFHFMQSIRTPNRDFFMTAVTLLGDKYCVVALNCSMIAWLTWKRHFRAALHWAILFVLSYGCVWVIKHVWYSPRPILPAISGLAKSSLPSGHTTMTLVYFGFLSVLLDIRQKKYLYLGTTLLVLLIAFSRLYLGAHWLTDILSGMMLAMACLFFVSLSYFRQHAPAISGRSLISAACVMIALIWTVWASYNLHNSVEKYQTKHQTLSLTESNWWQTLNSTLPLYRYNRLGSPKEPLNLQWLGNIEDIKQALIATGWHNHPTAATFRGAVFRAIAQPKLQRLSLLPQLFRNQPAALLMTKSIDGKLLYELRLWPLPANIGTQSLWVGNVKKHTEPRSLLKLHLRHKNERFTDVTQALDLDLKRKRLHRQRLTREQAQQLPEQIDWQGPVLQIR